MAALDFLITDETTGLRVQIVITENVEGTLNFDLKVLDGVIGDLNGLFFDISDINGLTSEGLMFDGADVTETAVGDDSVTKVDNYNNINGEVKKDYGGFDAGVQFGTQGMAQDDIQETSFTLSHTGGDLTLEDFAEVNFAVRLTSVGDVDGSRDDSLKIATTSPEAPVDEEPPVIEETVNLANPDTLFVTNTEAFGDVDVPEEQTSILSDDTTNDAAYEGSVVAANGVSIPETDSFDYVEVDGSEGGLLRVYEDGTLDFSANGEFDDVGTDEPVFTEFNYTIEGGSTATITVEVIGGDEGGGGGFSEDDVFEDDFVEEVFYEEPILDFV